jgi:two-component system sensor kinase
MSTDSDNPDLRQARLEITRLTGELEASRKELDVFSYSVSHDLRAPLRAVDGYSRMLVEDFADRLDDDGRRILGVIRNEAQRMGRLIDALLVFCRIGRQQLDWETIDMQEMAQAVFDELAARERDREMRFHLHPLPAARGSRAMIRQVWEQLIGNAIKFTQGRAVAEIEIGAREGEDAVPVYYIKDNGAGFDMRLAEKLFGIFQRFHTEDEFPGIGLGLALVQRILHRHGGDIRAEAEVDRGATFSFTIPPPKP